MRSYLLAAVLVPAAGAAFGQIAANPDGEASPAVAAPAQGFLGKDQLVNQIESWRATNLPHLTPPDPITARFEPRLDDIKAAVQDAKGDAALDKPRKDFDAWKKDLLAQKFKDAKARGMSRESLADFASDETKIADFSAALHLRLSQEVAARSVTETQQRALTATTDPSQFFDGSRIANGLKTSPALGASGDPSMVTAPPAVTDPHDPARYAKVREILLSQIPAGSKRRRERMAKIVDSAIAEAIRQGADPLLALSVIQNESGFNPSAESPVGARGLMQIMPSTGRGLGVRDASELYDVQTNLRAGIRFLKSLCSTFSVKSAVAAYNAGPGAVQKYGGVPPYRETQGYVKNVLAYYAKLQQYMTA